MQVFTATTVTPTQSISSASTSSSNDVTTSASSRTDIGVSATATTSTGITTTPQGYQLNVLTNPLASDTSDGGLSSGAKGGIIGGVIGGVVVVAVLAGVLVFLSSRRNRRRQEVHLGIAGEGVSVPKEETVPGETLGARLRYPVED